MPFYVEAPADQYGNRFYLAAVVEGSIVETGYGQGLEIIAPDSFKSQWPRVSYHPSRWIECPGPARELKDWADCDKIISSIPSDKKLIDEKSIKTVQNKMTAVLVLVLSNFDNMTLAALNNSVQGFGRVSKESLAYKPAFDFNLIKESGDPYDLDALRDACAFEVNRRVKAGTFN